MPRCEISDCAQMSKTIIAVRHFGLGGRESLETAVTSFLISLTYSLLNTITYFFKSLRMKIHVFLYLLISKACKKGNKRFLICFQYQDAPNIFARN